MYDILPKKEATFQLDVVGTDTGLQYKGEFTVKTILTIGERHSEELEKTRLLSDYANPSDGLYGIATYLSKVRASVTDSPKWWKDTLDGAEILDENVIIALYDECVKVQTEWKLKLKEKAENTIETIKEDEKEAKK